MVEILVKDRHSFFLFKAVIVLLFAAICLSGCFSAPAEKQAECDQIASYNTFSEYDNLALFAEALLLINRYHADANDFTGLVYSAINGMVADLDPYSSFLEPESLEALTESTDGSFVGIGVNVESDDNGIKVIAPLDNSPALEAGITAGDIITAVDGHSVGGISLGDAITEMRGKKGSKIKVTVRHDDGNSEDIELIRSEVHLSCVESCRVFDDSTGFLRIRQFTSSAAKEVEKALRLLANRDIARLILDLRDNPGGVLSSAIGVSEFFLEKGRTVVTLKNRAADKKTRDYKSGGGYKFPDMPLAVLVNHDSASASEIVAGALRDNQRAVIVGNRTYGKASIQSVIKMSLRPEYALRLTTGCYYTPAGKLIHGCGILPDEEVSLSRVQHSKLRNYYMRRTYREDKSGIPDDDLQLARAIEMLHDSEMKKENP
ncbi:MAG: S41 family peptidase [Kiritimatiellia bacterium]